MSNMSLGLTIKAETIPMKWPRPEVTKRLRVRIRCECWASTLRTSVCHNTMMTLPKEDVPWSLQGSLGVGRPEQVVWITNNHLGHSFKFIAVIQLGKKQCPSDRVEKRIGWTSIRTCPAALSQEREVTHHVMLFYCLQAQLVGCCATPIFKTTERKTLPHGHSQSKKEWKQALNNPCCVILY